MKFTKVELENYTVFTEQKCTFSPGINVFLGKNGTGKTHLMKLLYSAGVSANGRITFANKLVRTMLPLKWQLSRLVSQKQGFKSANLLVNACDDKENFSLSLKFNRLTKKWQGVEEGLDAWEQHFDKSQFVFIPAKEVLSNNYNLNAAVERGNVQFDDTYLDILNAAKIDISSDDADTTEKENLLYEIEQLIGGKVVYDASQDIFFLQTEKEQQEFNLVSEGIRKLGLLWILIKNGALAKDSVLFWDEPEANINPSSIPIVARILLALERHDVQIFISTHDYFLCKYLDVYRKADNQVQYHSFYLQDGVLQYETAEQFTLLEHNDIMKAFISLYRQEVGAALDE